jgi:hypothetical protein
VFPETRLGKRTLSYARQKFSNENLAPLKRGDIRRAQLKPFFIPPFFYKTTMPNTSGGFESFHWKDGTIGLLSSIE